ncbi:TonB-system energizer ExbB [Hydrogenovibrio sp. 3SP14C1]|uniref:TonB-system energizer ExbB n=1 Tax=Hydrogenovibrio sp. 3SP14C1 TaxID=3038774 RepID=UPI002416901E|nr:TonB-system energizer ExbB [Hydrogenovibrio sp. 3SP14C1]MDG4812189.1 TonB-system energizer ExbB [Hydrogenovibrio sp. 3SP14C1]
MEFLKLYLDITVFSILGLMSFIMVWLAIERKLFFSRLQLNQYDGLESLKVASTNNLTTIASIGSNAPYVGLLGTVLGILVTFYELGLNNQIETGQIMMGLALALKATAGGIALAIPSIIIYNGLLRKVDVIELEYQAHQKKSASSRT